jgi:hypothetical protein
MVRVSRGAKRHKAARNGTKRHETAPNGTERHQTAPNGTKRHQTARNGTKRHALDCDFGSFSCLFRAVTSLTIKCCDNTPRCRSELGRVFRRNPSLRGPPLRLPSGIQLSKSFQKILPGYGMLRRDELAWVLNDRPAGPHRPGLLRRILYKDNYRLSREKRPELRIFFKRRSHKGLTPLPSREGGPEWPGGVCRRFPAKWHSEGESPSA